MGHTRIGERKTELDLFEIAYDLSAMSSEGHKQQKQQLVGAIDQGTSSSRFLVYTRDALLVGEPPLCSVNEEIILSYPHAGWVETDPEVIYGSVVECIEK